MAEMLTKIDLVILDELGYLPFNSSGGALLFHLLSKLYERTSVIITTNLSFSEWAQIFGPSRQICCANRLPGNGRKDDHRAPRPAHPPLPHPGNRQRQLPLQSQLRGRKEKEKGDASIDHNMTAET